MKSPNIVSTYSELEKLISDYEFEKAQNLIETSLTEDATKSMLVKIAGHTSGNLVYTFVSKVLQKDENSFWHKVASKVAFETFSDEHEAEKTGLYHILKAIEHDPTNWKMKEEALKHFRDGALPEKYIKPYAEAVLRQEPTNHIALMAVESEVEAF